MEVVLMEVQDPARGAPLFVPMGLAFLASWLEREKPHHRVSLATSEEDLMAMAPQVVGLSAVSPNFPRASALAARVRRELGVPVVLGGPHITGTHGSLPESFVAGVLGEGEETFAELLALLERESSPSPESLSAVPGLVFHDGSGRGTRLSGPRPMIRPLDRIPFPRREWPGIDLAAPWSFSSRGCPYRCRFCSTTEFWEAYRKHSAAYVVGELQVLINRHDLRHHCYMDDLFAVDARRLSEIAERATNQLTRRVDLTVTIRADLVEARMCDLLRALGVVYVHLGLESGSDRVLQWLKGEGASVEINQRALDLLHEHGIHAIGSFIIGAPGEEEDDLQATLRFITENTRARKMLSFTFGPLVPFPGTAVWSEAVRRGVIDPSRVDWEALDLDIRYFDMERFIMLNDRMSRERFAAWFERFREAWDDVRSTIAHRLSPAAPTGRSPGA